MTKPPPAPKPESRYWAAICAAAIMAGVWVYYRLSQATLTCLSDNCPPAGSFAHRQAVADANAMAPQTALMMAGGVLMVGALVRGVILLMRRRRK